MSSHYNALLARIHTIHDLQKAMQLLSWDRETNMPPKGDTARIDQMTTLRRLSHEMYTAAETGELIAAAAEELSDAPYDGDEASLIRYLQRDYADQQKLTADYVRRSSYVSGQARPAWIKARAENDFAHFQPWLEQVVELCQELAELYGYQDEPYDALLDKYESGMKTADVRAIFNAVKDELIPLRQAVEARLDAVDDGPVRQHYPLAAQRQFVRYVTEAVGYDYERGHLGTVIHPFATSFTRDDARITTRWYEDFLNPALFGGLHESGHAMYEQGTHPDLYRTPLARGTSLGIHESQSRMMENIVGRSRGFWEGHFPKLREVFPDQLRPYSAEDFYRAVNKVQPSYIRVEADELTYNFHIILRFEIEQALLNGELAVADLPAAWNAKMNELLGVVPPTDTLGCLQDVHWSRPGFGYFPTYALGNLYAAQFFETAVSQQPKIAEELQVGKTEGLLLWLRENIHQHGRKFTAQELVTRITGSALSHKAFMRYVTPKFTELYRL